MAAPARVPIHRLDIDVLLYIFNLNANIFSPFENPLKTTRFASQVCRLWRSIILTTPSLWGKLLDLDHLCLYSDELKDVILQRIGPSSSLWIKATSKIAQERASVVQKIKAFFFSILDTHWERIEVLAVRFGVHGLDSKLLRAIYLPAPRLHVFDLDFHGFLPEFDVNWEVDGPVRPTVQSLFANEAPLLFTFHAAFIKPDLCASWHPNIRSLRLGSFFTPTELLDALKRMPLLESIDIRFSELISSDGPRGPSQIYLPNLHYIRLESEVVTGVAFLRRITPARGCSLVMPASEIGAGLQHSKNLTVALDFLSKFARNYFSYHVSTSITLEISSEFFSFQDKINPTDSPSPSIFDVSIFLSFESFSTDLSHLLTSFTLPTPAFDRVTELELKISISEFAPLATFFLSFPSIEKLVIDEAGLNSILYAQKQVPQPLFPVLDKLRLDYLPFNLSGWGSTQDFTYISASVGYFLQAHKNSGRPISVLDLTTCPMDREPKLVPCVEVVGMKVLWKMWGASEVFEFECR
ncbi:hypothetical protein GALMADRAFT_145873 [Galerina marginata CBS 339.88]|uniref:Uncharacterized protein n=1 Tax=Galerina marginata (strain CBS 339.88) TaxID=685588 RepID=A0A067SMA4_GALM3|nr:hypothetical protein GALMADRAFT_145873 [Galerina marginata CBS 339.88]